VDKCYSWRGRKRVLKTLRNDDRAVRSGAVVKRSTFIAGHEEWRPSEGAPGTRLVGALAAIPALIRQFGVDPEAVLREAGVSSEALADPSGRIAWERAVRLVRIAAIRTDCPHFGLLAGGKWRLMDLGLLGELVRHSSTVASALHELIVNHHLNSEGALFFLAQQGDVVDLGFAAYVPFAESMNHFYEGVLAAIMNFMRELCGNGWSASAVFFAHPLPIDVAPYVECFRAPLHFDSSFYAVRFPAKWLARPVAGAEPNRLRLAREQASVADGGVLVDKVYRAVRTLLLYGKASGADISQALAMHRRTLNRRLSAEGTTFRHVLDRVRFAVAKELLQNSELSLPDIAYALGYTNSVAFIPAFRRWAGTTPGAWRQSSHSARDPAAVRTPRVRAERHVPD
jgi:AraC-like DNA-binding protein